MLVVLCMGGVKHNTVCPAFLQGMVARPRRKACSGTPYKFCGEPFTKFVGGQRPRRPGTVKTVPYRLFYIVWSAMKQPVGSPDPAETLPDLPLKTCIKPTMVCRAGCPHPAGEKPCRPPQTLQIFVGDDACIVPHDGLCRRFHHVVLRKAAGAQCAPLRSQQIFCCIVPTRCICVLRPY